MPNDSAPPPPPLPHDADADAAIGHRSHEQRQQQQPPAVPGVGTPGGDSWAGTDTLPAEEAVAEQQLTTTPSLWAVVLAGGIGSRFWPLSTPERPKQLLALVGERPLIADTVARLAPLVPPERVLVVTSRDIADAIRRTIPDVPDGNFLVEPRPLGTAAALAWGAQEIVSRAGPETVFVTLHADLAVEYPDLFRSAVKRAAVLATGDGNLVVLAARPTRPDTGFGYMLLGPAIEAPAQVTTHEGPAIPLGAPARVSRFVEKPGPMLAETLIAEGAMWNAGVFVWRARTVLDALTQHTAELWPGLQALQAGEYERFGGMIQSVSIDRGLLERSDRVIALPAEFGWDDVGTWAALRRVRALDDSGNGTAGTVHCIDSSGNVVHTETGTVVTFGVSSLLVVALPGLTLVTTLDRASELNLLLDQLPAEMRRKPLG